MTSGKICRQRIAHVGRRRTAATGQVVRRYRSKRIIVPVDRALGGRFHERQQGCHQARVRATAIVAAGLPGRAFPDHAMLVSSPASVL